MSFSRALLGLFNSTTDVLQYIFARIVLSILIVAGLLFGWSLILAGRFEIAHRILFFSLAHPWWTVYPAVIAMAYLVVYEILDRRDYRDFHPKEK